MERYLERYAGGQQVPAAQCAHARVPAQGGLRELSPPHCLHQVYRQPKRQGKGRSHVKNLNYVDKKYGTSTYLD